jgi:hypothetical protein
LQDVEFKRPIIPIVGESFEGHYIHGSKVMNCFMESDYIEHSFVDNLTQARIEIKKDQETTYFLVEPPSTQY